MSDKLISQSRIKQIRNPFGFDFVVQWDKERAVLKGDGQWVSLIEKLADHAARHLFMKVYNQYHDEQVLKLRQSGNEIAAKKYRVPREVENKIWYLITGDNKYPVPGKEELEQETANLKVLEDEIQKLDQVSLANSETRSISDLLDSANTEAMQKAAGKESSVSKGIAKLGNTEVTGNDKLIPPKRAQMEQIESEPPARPAQDNPMEPGPAQEPEQPKEDAEFGDLQGLS